MKQTLQIGKSPAIIAIALMVSITGAAFGQNNSNHKDKDEDDLWQAIGDDTVFTNRFVEINNSLLVHGKITADSIDIPGVVKITDTVVQFNKTVQVKGQIIVDSVHVKGPLVIGDSTFSIISNVLVPPTTLVDQIRSDVGMIALGNGTTTNPPLNFSNILVGIGTQTPTEKLHVLDGNAMVSSTGAFPGNTRGYYIQGLPALRFPGNTSNFFTNVSVGDSAGSSITSGTQNVMVGKSAGSVVTTQFNVTCFGHRAGETSIGVNNTFIGAFAGKDERQDNNTMVGTGAGVFYNFGNLNTMIGAFAGGATGTFGGENTFVGASSGGGFANRGEANTYIGTRAGLTAQTPTPGVFSLGRDNIFMGVNAGQMTNTSSTAVNNGNRNVYIGLNSGQFTGPANVTASDNILLGANTSLGSAILTNAIALGANTIVTTPNTMILGNGVNVGIDLSNNVPAERLDVNGNGRFRALPSAANQNNALTQVVVADANGKLQWRDANTIGGGTAICGTGIIANFLPKWTGADFCQSQISDDGTSVKINNTALTIAKLNVDAGTSNNGIFCRAISSPASSHVGIFVQAANATSTNIGADFSASSASSSAFNTGLQGSAIGVTGSTNRGIDFQASNGTLNEGGEFKANGGANNRGIVATGKNGTNINTGGTFDATGVSAILNTGISTSANEAQFNIALDASVPGSPNNFAAIFSGNIVFNGTLSGTNNVVTSDIMFKTNTDFITNTPSIISQLQPKKFYFDTTNYPRFNFSNKLQYGFTAQDVEQILPELVYVSNQPARYDSAGNMIYPSISYKSLNYNAFFAILTQGLKDGIKKDSILQAQIDALSSLLSQCCSTNTRTNENGQILKQELKLTLPDAPVLGDAKPNPNTGTAEIQYFIPEQTNNAKIIFTDMLGRVMQERKLETGYGLLSIDTKELPNGNYLYSLIINGNKFDSKTMVKTK